MNKLFAILILILAQSIYGQETTDFTIFHRLLIFNSDGEMLVVKIRNTDFWVTPGFYQTEQQSIRQDLKNIADSYGIEVSNPELKGVFTLKREMNQASSTSIRNVFSAKMLNGVLKNPEGIEEIKWLSTEDALTQISFPHINAMIDQIVKNPTNVWGGTLLQYKEGEAFKTKILEEFYPMTAPNGDAAKVNGN